MSDQRSAKQSLLWFVEAWRDGYDGKSIPGEREAFEEIKRRLSDETDAEHRARCDLIDAMSIIDAVLTLGALTDSERLVWGEWLTRTRAKYPQQKARAPETIGR
jgi:hypothetical protein